MKKIRFTLIAAAGVLAIIQFVPYGRNHVNPPVRQEPAWDAQQTREFARRACFDCHSNETKWPWYASIAPSSWFLQNHVNEGRGRLNFSEWNRKQEDAKEAVEEVQKGAMPPWSYVLGHPDAKLSAAERQAFARGMQATLAKQGGQTERAGGGQKQD